MRSEGLSNDNMYHEDSHSPESNISILIMLRVMQRMDGDDDTLSSHQSGEVRPFRSG